MSAYANNNDTKVKMCGGGCCWVWGISMCVSFACVLLMIRFQMAIPALSVPEKRREDEVFHLP